jgi:hypothetical protein
VSPTSSDLAFEAEVLRLNDRYLDELVEAFDICPFARGARAGGGVERRVLHDQTPDVASGLAAIAELERDPKVVIGLLIFPRLEITPAAFDRLLGELREADLQRRPREAGGRAPFAMAAFHPEAPYSDESPQRMVSFFRRSPDPTIQLVRFDALDAVKSRGAPGGAFFFEWSAKGWAELERRTAELPVSERIARDNHATAMREGVARLQSIYDDIRADRARAYARFR